MARATLLRDGKQLCFISVEVETSDGKPIAHASSVVRARLAAPESKLHLSAGDHGASDPGSMGPLIGQLPFIGGRGIQVEHMTSGTAAGDAIPGRERRRLGRRCTKARCSRCSIPPARWRPGPSRSRPLQGLHARDAGADPGACAQVDLVAYETCRQRDGELLWSDAEVASAADGAVVARGTVIYRILT